MILSAQRQNFVARNQLLAKVIAMNDNSEKLIRRAKPGFKSLEAGDLVAREYERHGALMEALRQSEADGEAAQEPMNKTDVER